MESKHDGIKTHKDVQANACVLHTTMIILCAVRYRMTYAHLPAYLCVFSAVEACAAGETKVCLFMRGVEFLMQDHDAAAEATIAAACSSECDTTQCFVMQLCASSSSRKCWETRFPKNHMPPKQPIFLSFVAVLTVR
jgi:hypothetical protein